MPLDDDVNEAITSLHFGATLPFWDMAVRVQLTRLQPTQSRVMGALAATKRCNKGIGTNADVFAMNALKEEMEQRFVRGEGYGFYSIENRIDAIFLLIAIRTILTMADRIVEQLKPLGKETEAAQVRNAFSSKYGLVTHLRDVILHYDAYAVGRGNRRDLIRDADEGLGITEDDNGVILIMWAGHRLRLLDAAWAALNLSMDLSQMYFGRLNEP